MNVPRNFIYCYAFYHQYQVELCNPIRLNTCRLVEVLTFAGASDMHLWENGESEGDIANSV